MVHRGKLDLFEDWYKSGLCSYGRKRGMGHIGFKPLPDVASFLLLLTCVTSYFPCRGRYIACPLSCVKIVG